jgi:ribosome recycling factor
MSFDKSDLDRRMDGAVAQLQKEYSGLRTGRASTNLLEHVMVEAYGSMMPINQCGIGFGARAPDVDRYGLGRQFKQGG